LRGPVVADPSDPPLAGAVFRNGSTAEILGSQRLSSVYGLLLIASNLLMADLARLRTYIRPLEVAYVDAGP